MSTRIISFSPSATEIVCALGLESYLVGRSHDCDFPEPVKHLPIVTTNNPDNFANPQLREPDQMAANIVSVYKINTAFLKQLEPDIIFTGSERWADIFSAEEIEAAVKSYVSKKVQIISLKQRSLDDLLNNITIIARALSVDGEGIKLSEDMQERVDIIRHKLKYLENKPAVACIEGFQPFMIAGKQVSELVSIAGGTAVGCVGWEAIRLLNPDVLLLISCGFSIQQTLKEIDSLIQMPGFSELSAVKNKRIYIVDGKQCFSNVGPRIVDLLEMLAEIIHPRQFIFGYEGRGWIKFVF